MRFYILPKEPTIAKDKDGKPIFSLVVYRHDEERIDPAASTADVGGGILTFTITLTVPEADMRKVRGRLRARFFGGDGDATEDVDLAIVPFLDGKVSVAVAGETGADTGADREFVKGAVGTGKVSAVGGNSKAVMVKLTQAGASLMSQLERLRTLPINAEYELRFEHRLTGVSMNVWCDINSSYTLIQEVLHTSHEYDDGYLGMSENHVQVDKITSVTETLVRNKTAGVVVTPQTSEVDNDTLLSLEKFGFEMLNKEMEKAIQASPPPKEIDRTYLESFRTSAANNFNFTLDRKMVLVRDYTPSANISNVFREGEFDEMVAFVDLRSGFFNFLKIPIRVNADFATLPIDSTTVTVTYERRRIGGAGREVRTDSFNFTDGATIKTFLAYANSLAELTYDWEAIVHYKGSADTYRFGQQRAKEEFLVVDVGKMGMIAVDVGFGLADLETFPAAKVSLRYRSAALGRTVEREIKLEKAQQTALWTEVIREEPKTGFEYKVDWLRKTGEILQGNWTRSNAARLRFDAPVQDRLKVMVLCSGNFKDGPDQIAQIGVNLQYIDEANQYTQEGSVVFTEEKQQLPWEIELRNPNLRDYRYKYTVVYKDGVTRNVPETGWLKGDPGFITVGEKYTLRVDVLPTLLTFPPHAKLVQVDFTYADGGRTETDTLVFSAEEKTKKTWRVRGEPGGRKDYTYKITYFGEDGSIREKGPVASSAEALVIPPPPAPVVTPPGP